MGSIFEDSIDASREMAAYEYLWSKKYDSFKKLSDLFRKYPGYLPSSFVDEADVENNHQYLSQHFIFKDSHIKPKFVIGDTLNYPKGLLDATHPLVGFYYDGNLDLLGSNSIAIVGARKASDKGLRRAAKLARLLVKAKVTIVSGLAKGIDTAALNAAIEEGGNTIGVIGTPLNYYYPKENESLQRKIAKEHLLLSQVPFIKYSEAKDYRFNRGFFPERNKTMSAISRGTVIVEASNTSGTLTQARAALAQGRRLFILQNCFENQSINWPEYFEKKGAIRVREVEDILKYLS